MTVLLVEFKRFDFLITVNELIEQHRKIETKNSCIFTVAIFRKAKSDIVTHVKIPTNFIHFRQISVNANKKIKRKSLEGTKIISHKRLFLDPL